MIADDHNRAFVQHVADTLAHRGACGLQGIFVLVGDVALDERSAFLLLFHGFLLVVGVTGFGYSEMQVRTWCCFTVGARLRAMRALRVARRKATGPVQAAKCARSRPPGAAGKLGLGGSWLGPHVDADSGTQRHGVEDGFGGGRLAAGVAWRWIGIGGAMKRGRSSQLWPDLVPVVRTKLFACHFAAGLLFDGWTMLDRDRTDAFYPLVQKRCGNIDRTSEFSLLRV